MPGIQLYIEHLDPQFVHRFIRPDGSAGLIPCLRLVAFANLSSQLVTHKDSRDYLITKCVIDTGSFISIVPQRIWQYFLPGVVTPLPFDPATPPHHRQVTIAGGSFPFELGEFALRLEDRLRNHLTATVVAKFTGDGGRLPIPLTLGLRGGVLDGRTFAATPDPAAPHGQGWALRDP